MYICSKCKSFNIETKTGYDYFDIFECKVCGYWTFERIEDCCRESYTIITIDRKTPDLAFLYRQCIYCGGSQNRTKPLSFKKFGDVIRTEFCAETYESWRKKRRKEQDHLTESRRNYNYLNSPRYKYYLYLISPEWHAKRELINKRDNNICQKCFVKPSEDVHHLTYENLGNEKLIDLLSICRECHMEIHGIKTNK